MNIPKYNINQLIDILRKFYSCHFHVQQYRYYPVPQSSCQTAARNNRHTMICNMYKIRLPFFGCITTNTDTPSHSERNINVNHFGWYFRIIQPLIPAIWFHFPNILFIGLRIFQKIGLIISLMFY